MENGRRKLTVEQVLEARWRFISGERELTKLSRDYGVSRESLKNAVLEFTFKDLPMPLGRCADAPQVETL